VLQSDLPAALTNMANCKLQVFNKLAGLMLNQSVAAPPQIGDKNTLLNTPVPSGMGSGNTIVGPKLPGGNTTYDRGGTAIGAGACADSTSVAIGAGANAGACAKKP
jgi:hypothetical protein